MTAGSSGLGQRLVAQSQRESALKADATYRMVASMGTHWSVLVWGDVRVNPTEEGLLGYCSYKGTGQD